MGWAEGVSFLGWPRATAPLPECRDGLGSPGQRNEGHGAWEDPQHRAPTVQSSCPGMWVTQLPLWRTVGSREDVGRCLGSRVTLEGGPLAFSPGRVAPQLCLCPSRETSVSLLEGERMGCGGPHRGKAHFTPKQESKTQTSKEMRPTCTCSPCGPWLGSWDRGGGP